MEKSLIGRKVFLSDNRVMPKNPAIYQNIFLLHLFLLYKILGILQKSHDHNNTYFPVISCRRRRIKYKILQWFLKFYIVLEGEKIPAWFLVWLDYIFLRARYFPVWFIPAKFIKSIPSQNVWNPSNLQLMLV